MIVPSILLALAALQTTAAPAATAEHVAIQAANIDRSATFYHEAFGLRIIPTPLKNRRWLDLGNGLALHILDGRTAPKPSNRNEHLALHVDDLATVIAWLDQHGRVWTTLRAHRTRCSSGSTASARSMRRIPMAIGWRSGTRAALRHNDLAADRDRGYRAAPLLAACLTGEPSPLFGLFGFALHPGP